MTDSAYNVWDEPETVSEAFGSSTRTKTSSYDSAGRLTGSEVTSNYGPLATLPAVSDEYSSETGVMVKQSTTVSGKTQTITSAYNTLGQLIEYTDANSNKSTYSYDTDGRVSEMSDGKGSQVYAYDATTGALRKLLDSAAGTFTASYDLAGRMTSESYPNGMTAKYTYDEAGQVTHIEYVKEAHCATTCPEVWFSEGVSYSVHGEELSRSNSLSSETYTYDTVGRLTEVKETPTGKGCTVRLYAYDEDSNRTSLTTREPGLEGKCATTGGSKETHTYDAADRVTDTGTSYDPLGNTTSLPATDAGGHEIKSSYYVSNQTHTSTQNGKTQTYELDPDARPHEIITEEGETKTSSINHYAGPGEAICWTEEGSGKYTRNIPGIDGTLTATEQNGSAPVLQLHDLQGDIIATAGISETETKLASTYNPTEFGVPTTTNPPKYSWQGASGLPTEFASGATASSGTGYVPQLGRPLQTQPINPPGSAPTGTWASGPYVSGMEAWVGQSDAAWAAETSTRQAARQQKAEQEATEAAEAACRANPEACLPPGAELGDPSVLLTGGQSLLVAGIFRSGEDIVKQISRLKIPSLAGIFIQAIATLAQPVLNGLAGGLEQCAGDISTTKIEARCQLWVNFVLAFPPIQTGSGICWGKKYTRRGKMHWTFPYCETFYRWP